MCNWIEFSFYEIIYWLFFNKAVNKRKCFTKLRHWTITEHVLLSVWIMRPPNYNFSINSQKEDCDEHETESNCVECLTKIANENNFTWKWAQLSSRREFTGSTMRPSKCWTRAYIKRNFVGVKGVKFGVRWLG